jgi:DNA-binding MarR family transcriptional regulator
MRDAEAGGLRDSHRARLSGTPPIKRRLAGALTKHLSVNLTNTPDSLVALTFLPEQDRCVHPKAPPSIDNRSGSAASPSEGGDLRDNGGPRNDRRRDGGGSAASSNAGGSAGAADSDNDRRRIETLRAAIENALTRTSADEPRHRHRSRPSPAAWRFEAAVLIEQIEATAEALAAASSAVGSSVPLPRGSARLKVLRAIEHSRGCPSFSDLARLLRLSRQTARGLAVAAARAGQVELFSDPADRRTVNAALTPKGRRALALHRADGEILASSLLQGLDLRRMLLLSHILRAVRERSLRLQRDAQRRRRDAQQTRRNAEQSRPGAEQAQRSTQRPQAGAEQAQRGTQRPQRHR